MKKSLITIAAASMLLAACSSNTPTISKYSVHVVEDDRAAITIDKLDDYQKDDIVSFTVTILDEEYVLESVTVSNYNDSSKVVEVTKSATSYFFMMPNFDVSISVSTSVKEYTIELSESPDVSLSLVDITTNKAKKGDTVTVNASVINPEKILEAVNVTSKMDPTISVNVIKGSENNYYFEMPNYDVYVGTLTSSVKYDVTTSSDQYSEVTCNASYAAGETVLFTARALSSVKRISSIKVEKSNGEEVTYEHISGNTYSFVMPSGNVTITVITEDVKYLVSLIESEDFTLVIDSTDGLYVPGDVVTVTVTPISTSAVKELVVKTGETKLEVELVEENKYQFVMPESNVSVQVVGKSLVNKVTVTPNEHASVSIMGSKEEFMVGDEVIFTVSPSYGYKVTSIDVKTVSGEVVTYTGTSAFTFVMPDEEVVITVTTAQKYTVTVNADSHSSVTITSSKDYYDQGENISFTVTVTDSNYELDSVSVMVGSRAITTKQSGNTYSFTMPSGNVTINVTTKEKEQSTDPFTTITVFQGTYYYYDGYDDYTMRLRVVFDGEGKVSWYLTYECEDYGGYDYYSVRSKPSDMEGTEKANGENLVYTYDGTKDQITFNSKVKMTYKDLVLQINRSGSNITSVNFLENLDNGDFYQCGTTKLYKR